MIHAPLTYEILEKISIIDENRALMKRIGLPQIIVNQLRKNAKKKSSYASNKIEGNPLTEKQANEVIDRDEQKHFLLLEQDVRNYYSALNLLEEKLKNKKPFSKRLILEVQALVKKGASKEKIGLRKPMPPGALFAVFDSQTGRPEYIPPECRDIPSLLDELVKYVNTTEDHPLIVAAVVHYQLVTIHPFEDGNGRTARLLSGYILDYNGYGFGGIGSLEEYFTYDPDEYYASLQMGLPALYYSGRDNPPRPGIWMMYFLRMVELYSTGCLARAYNMVNNSAISDSTYNDWVRQQFATDGSHPELTKLIIDNLSYEESYMHIHTFVYKMASEEQARVYNKRIPNFGDAYQLKPKDLLILSDFLDMGDFDSPIKSTAIGISRYSDNSVILLML